MSNASKFIFLLLAVVGLTLVGCFGVQQQSAFQNESLIAPNTEQDTESIPVTLSQGLNDCLRDNVYGKRENWVILAEQYCAPLLPNDCLFGYGKAAYEQVYLGNNESGFDYRGRDNNCVPGEDGGCIHKPSGGKFGVYCPTEFSADLQSCKSKINYSEHSEESNYQSDGFFIHYTYLGCWDEIPEDCMFTGIIVEPYVNLFFCRVE